MKVAYIYPYSP